MNIPKLGEVLAEIQDALKIEIEVTNKSRNDIADRLVALRTDLIEQVSVSIDTMAMQIDAFLAERAVKLDEIIQGDRQMPEIAKAA